MGGGGGGQLALGVGASLTVGCRWLALAVSADVSVAAAVTRELVCAVVVSRTVVVVHRVMVWWYSKLRLLGLKKGDRLMSASAVVVVVQASTGF